MVARLARRVFGGGKRRAGVVVVGGVRRVHVGKDAARDGVEVLDGGGLAVDGEVAVVGGVAEVVQVFADAEAAVAGDEVAAVFGLEGVVEAVDVYADVVAKRAFVERLDDAAVAHGADAFDVAFADGFKDEAVVGGKGG